MKGLRDRVERELRQDILPFWLKYAVDEEHGGFRGQISNDLTIDAKAHKGLILNARILWTFARAYRVYHDDIYLRAAGRAYEYLKRYFCDPEYGGVYWLVDYQGNLVDAKKRIYGQAFTIYALAEYAAATGDKEPLNKAVSLQKLIEQTGYDPQYGGYFETFERDWKLADQQRLSDVDMDEKKSMNTHLHVLEAYANLLRIWNDDDLRDRLRALLRIFLDHILDRKTHHLRMFFDEKWNVRSGHFSFGHDIEASWLLCEAAEVLEDTKLLKEVHKAGIAMAESVYEEALDTDGGVLYEGTIREVIDTDKHWWPQAEAVVGFLNAYELSGQEHFLKASNRTWAFIEQYIVDREHGEWYWKVSRAGMPSDDKYKVDAWKCPYHNSRACFEVMERLDRIEKKHPEQVHALKAEILPVRAHERGQI